ncbi:hypothetical protein XIS1_890007 [Xenorhabdus innexi]|uniref:Uncharacterized protein n=1 Tax=Xenorhabdus innexi TaxID=290109 RepID=A0A1N6N1D0_9GAMM|nr:hypothetical protein XIS1_890007 [Xenorhabdus innexi]
MFDLKTGIQITDWMKFLLKLFGNEKKIKPIFLAPFVELYGVKNIGFN